MPIRLSLLPSLVLALVSSTYYFWSASLRHAQYDTYAFDLGLLAQVTWNNLHGRWFETTVLPFNYLAEHLSPVLVLASPLLLVWPRPESLLGLQSLAIGLAGVGIFLVALERSGSRAAALLIQLAYAIAPETGWMAWDEFHPITLAMPALTFGTFLLWRKRFRSAALAGGLALLANEDSALVVGPFGLLLAAAASGRARLWGVALAVLATTWLVGYLFLIVPAVRPPELADQLPHPDLRAYSQCGSSLGDVTRCLLNPAEIVSRATTPGDRDAVLSFLAPTVGLAVLGPSFLATIPRWLAQLLGNDPTSFKLHYAALLVTGAYLASAEALGWIRQLEARVAGLRDRARQAAPAQTPDAPTRRPTPNTQPAAVLAAALVATSSLIAFVLGGPLPAGGAQRGYSSSQQERGQRIDAALQRVPADPALSIAATSSILPHLALRPALVFAGDGRCPDPDFFAVDLRDSYPYGEPILHRRIDRARADPAYAAVFDADDVLVLQWIAPAPSMERADLFGGIVRLEGLDLRENDDGLGLRPRWRKVGATARDYHYFVHVVDSSGRMFSQADGQLQGGLLGGFVNGCLARDQVRLPGPPRGQWSDYQLWIGWYDFPSGERLRLADGRDHIEIPLSAFS